MPAGTVGRTTTAKKSNRKWNNLFGARQHKRPAPAVGKPVTLPYNPLRDVACQQIGVPYGSVAVDGRPPHVRSHEMRLDKRSGSRPSPVEGRQPAALSTN